MKHDNARAGCDSDVRWLTSFVSLAPAITELFVTRTTTLTLRLDFRERSAHCLRSVAFQTQAPKPFLLLFLLLDLKVSADICFGWRNPTDYRNDTEQNLTENIFMDWFQTHIPISFVVQLLK